MYQVYIAVSPSNTYYVGITSQGFEVRKNQHYEKAFYNKLKTPFYKALRKYSSQMEWFVLASDLTKSQACEMEKKYIIKYKAFYEVYNVTPGGELPWNTGTKGVCKRTPESIKKQFISRAGYEHSETTKNKIGAAHKGKKVSPEATEKYIKSRGCKPIEMYKDGVLVVTFVNRSKFCRENNMTMGRIQDCLNGKTKTYKGFCFKYKTK